MANDGSNHSGNGGDGFEKDGTVEDFVRGDISAVPARGDVESEAE